MASPAPCRTQHASSPKVLCRFDKTVPPLHASKGADALQAFSKQVAPLITQYVAAMDRIKMREALRLAMAISTEGNRFIQVRCWGLSDSALQKLRTFSTVAGAPC